MHSTQTQVNFAFLTVGFLVQIYWSPPIFAFELTFVHDAPALTAAWAGAINTVEAASAMLPPY